MVCTPKKTNLIKISINHAISLNPRDSLALITKAHLYEQAENLEEALKSYEAVLRVDAMNKRAREEITRIEEELIKRQREEEEDSQK